MTYFPGNRSHRIWKYAVKIENGIFIRKKKKEFHKVPAKKKKKKLENKNCNWIIPCIWKPSKYKQHEKNIYEVTKKCFTLSVLSGLEEKKKIFWKIEKDIIFVATNTCCTCTAKALANFAFAKQKINKLKLISGHRCSAYKGIRPTYFDYILNGYCSSYY